MRARRESTCRTMEMFIKKFVQLLVGNPETVFSINKKTEVITMKCKACGHVSECDPRHKLCNYIVKNPPKDKSKEKKDKQMRARNKSARMKVQSWMRQRRKERRKRRRG